jgi:hypothetical protein
MGSEMEKLNSAKSIYQNSILGIFCFSYRFKASSGIVIRWQEQDRHFRAEGGPFHISGFCFSFQVELPLGISSDMRELTIGLAFRPAGTNQYDR